MKKQIEFDFGKWVQEGISVKSWDDSVVALHKHPNKEDLYYGISEHGCFICTPKELTMYQEEKPREIWVNEQESAGFHYSKVFSSKEEAESQKLPFVIRTVKFREVQDNEQ